VALQVRDAGLGARARELAVNRKRILRIVLSVLSIAVLGYLGFRAGRALQGTARSGDRDGSSVSVIRARR
jgi:hypothetical protein